MVNSDMTIIGGHQRLTVAMQLGYTEVPCAVVDVDKTREKALNIALNKITGAWDDDLLYLKIVEGALPEPLDTQINEEILRLNKLRNFEDYEIGLLLPHFYCPHCKENGGCQWTWIRFPEFVLPYQRAVMTFFAEEIENVRDCNGGTEAMENPSLRKSAGWTDSRSKWEKIFPIYIAYYDHIQHGSPGDFFLYIWGVRCYPSGIIKCRVSLTSIWNTLKRSVQTA